MKYKKPIKRETNVNHGNATTYVPLAGRSALFLHVFVTILLFSQDASLSLGFLSTSVRVISFSALHLLQVPFSYLQTKPLINSYHK